MKQSEMEQVSDKDLSMHFDAVTAVIIALSAIFELRHHGTQKPEMPTATIIPCYPSSCKNVFKACYDGYKILFH